MVPVHVIPQDMMMPPNMRSSMGPGPGSFGAMPGAMPPPLMPGAPSVAWLPPPGGAPAGSLGMPAAMMGTAPGGAPPGVATADSRSNQYVFGAAGGTVGRAGGRRHGAPRRVWLAVQPAALLVQEGWRVALLSLLWLVWARWSSSHGLLSASLADSFAAFFFPLL